MTGTWLIARDTLRELSHRKVVAAVAIAALDLTFSLVHLVSLQQRAMEAGMDELQRQEVANGKPSEAEAMKDMGEQMEGFCQAEFFGITGLFGVIVSLLVFSTLVATPLRDRQLRSLLVRPITRSSYLAGRLTAAALLLAAFWVLMSLGFLLFFQKQGSALPTMVRFAPLLLFFKSLMLGAVALAVSLYVGRPFLAAILTFFLSSDWVSSQGFLYLVLPGDDRLSIGSQLLQGRVMGYHDVAFAALYAIAITVAAMACALLRFQRMDVT